MDIIYYPYPVPVNRYTISVLGILFDHVFLPGVYLPKNHINIRDLEDEDKRLTMIQKSHPKTYGQIMIAFIRFLKEYQDLNGIFVGTVKSNGGELLEKESMDFAKHLEQAIYGVPPEGFTPLINQGVYFDVGGGNINSPDWITYPANAYVYSLKTQTPLFTDNLDFPLPERVEHHSDVETLASYLAMSTLTINLPRIKPLNSTEIIEVRIKMRDDIIAFKSAMVEYVDRFRQLIGDNPSLIKLQREADYISQSVIQPKINDLVRRLETPGEIFKSEMFDYGLDVVALLAKIKINPSPDNLVSIAGDAIEKGKDHIKDGIDRYLTSNETIKNSGLSLILKLPNKI